MLTKNGEVKSLLFLVTPSGRRCAGGPCQGSAIHHRWHQPDGMILWAFLFTDTERKKQPLITKACWIGYIKAQYNVESNSHSVLTNLQTFVFYSMQSTTVYTFSKKMIDFINSPANKSFCFKTCTTRSMNAGLIPSIGLLNN